MKKKTLQVALVLFFIIAGSLSNVSHMTDSNPVMPMTLNFKAIALANNPFPDYTNFIKQHLARLRINIEIEILDYEDFYYKLTKENDFDIACFEYSNKKTDIDFSDLYGLKSHYNIFGYDPSLDWNESISNGINEEFLEDINHDIGTNSTDRKETSWEWQNYLMDKICPMKPLYTVENYMVYWNNLYGYNGLNGLLESWGKMWWDGLHENQGDTSEIIIADDPWIELNPLFQYDPASAFISSACLDPLFWSKNYNFPIENNASGLWPHLLESYNVINETYIRFNCRKGIKWQTDPTGEFTNEYLDVEDIYFTLYCWKHLSKSMDAYYWLKDMTIVDKYTLDIFIDADPSTPECEAFAPALSMLNVLVLPEHFLNQTQVGFSILPNISHQSWTNFASNCFGTGLFEIQDNSISSTNLLIFDECWWLNTSITNNTALNFEERFGTFDHGLSNLEVRKISEPQTVLLEFEFGKVDIVNTGYFQDKITQYTNDPDFDIQTFNSGNLVIIAFNLRENRGYLGSRDITRWDSSLTVGRALRKVICYAIDRSEISQVLHNNNAIFTDSPIYTTFGDYCYPNIIQYNFDLDKAREYRDKAGLYNPPFTPPGLLEDWQKIVISLSVLPSIAFVLTIIYFINRSRRKIKIKELI
ncbi:MAG: hypothetical protein FK733_12115 [Asgard group archaeon]|nr:hypothetical protein [Asgard group archaeon]